MALLKLVAYGLVGYTLYTFARNTIDLETQRAGLGSSPRKGSGSGQGTEASDNPQVVLSGPGEGQDVVARQLDGGVMHHQVGRGVVHR